jgi:hypothetical protein
MAESMKENILMTRRKVTEFSSGLMVVSTMGCGKMGSNMGEVNIFPAKESSKLDNGKTVNASNGSMRIQPLAEMTRATRENEKNQG